MTLNIQCAQCAHGVHSVHLVCTVCTEQKVCAYLHICCHLCTRLLFSTNMYFHQVLCAHFSQKKSQHVPANCPLRPTTADHPGSQRAPQSGFSFLDSDTARWQKWIISRACLSGDGVPGTSRSLCSHGSHVCAHMEPVRTWNPSVCTVCTDGEQCAQGAQKNANCVESVQIVTRLKM